MIEKTQPFTVSDKKTIERIIDEDTVAINHMILPKNTGLPDHNANAPVYMIVARGQVTLRLDDQEPKTYPAGHIIQIPFKTHMRVVNTGETLTELFVVKAPGPKSMTS